MRKNKYKEDSLNLRVREVVNMKGNLSGFILASTLVGLLGLPTPLFGQNLFDEDEDFVSTLEKMADNAPVKNNNTDPKEALKLE